MSRLFLTRSSALFRISSRGYGRMGTQSDMFPAVTTPMLPDGTFKGKTAFITGGGTGLGFAMSERLAVLGANVCILGRRQAVLEAAAKKITASVSGANILPVQCDVRSAESVSSAVDACQEKFGLPNMVISNAAGNFVSPTERLSLNAFKTIIDIVLHGTLIVTLDIGKRLIAAQQPASFLAITTTYAQPGSAYVVPSATAKAGVEVMYKSLAAEWAKYGMRFNSIAPGPIKTEGAFSRLDPTGEMERHMMKRIGTGRSGETEELANLASYLLSDYASWVTGTVVTFDGGELNQMSGEMNALHQIKPEQWDAMEAMIRATNASQKNKAKL